MNKKYGATQSLNFKTNGKIMIDTMSEQEFTDVIYDNLINHEIISFKKKIKIEKFYIFYKYLMEWNKKINLTTVTCADEFIKKHIIDSAFLLKILRKTSDPNRTESIMDIGSGAGLPGIVLNILNPDLNILSVESILKKCNFQKAAARKLNLGNFKCLNANIFSYNNFSDVRAITTRAALNTDGLINLIEKMNIKNTVCLYPFLSKMDEIKKIENFKYKSKQVETDKILFYKTDYGNNKNNGLRLIAQFIVTPLIL